MSKNSLWNNWWKLIWKGWIYFKYSSLINYLLYNKTKQSFDKYLKSGDSLLDLWAGKLTYRNLVFNYTKNYKSIDFDKTHPELDYIWTTSSTWLPDNSFDCVFCSQVLEHVPDPKESFQEIYRLLKQWWIAIINTPFLWWIHLAPYDYYRYTRFSLYKLSQDAGFKIIELEEVWWLFAFLISNFNFITNSLFYNIPIIWKLVFFLNCILIKIFYYIDWFIWMEKTLPNTYFLVIRK